MTNNFILTDYAYSSILNMILSSDIKPGDRIREDLIAEKIGISRTPVREAVNQLVQNGFVVNIKRKGLYCVNITKSELLDLLEIRTALESISFNKCIDLATDKDIDNLKGIISDFNQKCNIILRDSNSDADKEMVMLHNEYDVKFHVSIAEVSHSSRLIKYITEIENTLIIARQRIYSNNEGKSIVLLSWKQHELMVESIQARDKTAALNMLNNHLELMRNTQVDIDESIIKPVSET